MSSLTSSSLSAIEAQSMAQYINQFLDLVDNLPNEITRHLTQLHQLHNNYLKLINKMDISVQSYNKLNQNLHQIDHNMINNNNNNNWSEHLSESKTRLAKKIESLLVQMQELSDEKLKHAQIITDLIETKSKELDFDYEEILHFSDTIANNNNNISISSSNKVSGKLSVNSSKTNPNSSTQPTNSTSYSTEDQKELMNGENSGNNRNGDKRLLPRRACALRPGEMNESNYQLIPKLVKQKTCKKSKYSTKTKSSHNFQISMSNFYRDMARRRAKLPIKIKNKKSVSLAIKRNANNSNTNRKTVQNYNKNTLVTNSGQKDSNTANNELFKSLNKRNIDRKKKKSSQSSSSSTSSTATSEGSSGESTSNDNDEKHCSSSLKSNTSQQNGKKETKRSGHSFQNSSSISNKWSNNKKSKTQIDESVDDLFIGEPIDPNEPVYCLCNQVSYGEMICCDNESCQIEWFHFPCVDLVHKPKGKWFCPKCRGDRSNVPKK